MPRWPTRTLAERFWPKVDQSGGPDACWPWVGARDPNGYGRVYIDGNGRLAHRVAFLLAHGRWPANGALHACDNPPCCNPAHLFDGDQAANLADAASKGRCAAGNTHPSRTHPDAFRQKLSAADIVHVLARVASGEPRRDVARDFGITPEAIGYHIAKQRRM